MLSRREKVLRPVWPSAGIEAEYRRRLRALLAQVHDSVLYWTRAAYRKNEPEMTQLVEEFAQDATPAADLRKVLRALSRRWFETIDDTAERLGRWFTKAAAQRSDRQLERILREGGFAVEFKLTRAQRDVLRATVEENVALIKSIPRRYLGEVEQLVMRSVATGRDLEYLTKAIEKRYDVTHKRAALISRDQNNKATGQLQRVRRLEMGLREAVWLHSHAGKQPRPTHVAMHGRRFNVDEGMWDPHERQWIQPGELINCRCSSRAVVPGLT